MPLPISQALHSSKDWLTSPLRVAYDFLFPPLDDLFLDDVSTTTGSAWSGNNAAKPSSYARGKSNVATTTSTFHADDSFDQLDVWDSFSDSPWSFITSRYAIALIIVVIINNRVQHICRPRGGATARLSQRQRIALRLPSLVLLARSVLILTTVVADAFLSESNPVNALLRACTTKSWRSAWLADTPMSGWALDRFGSSSRDALLRARDASALWAAFTSTCVAVISETIVRNLDADREEPPAFNLVGFAFLLHFYSFSPDAPANEHVYLCVLLQVLQILTIALSRCRPVYAPRLVISSVFGISALLHYALAASSGRYPFLEALTRMPEIALVLVVLLTVSLHALTMLLLEGSIQPHRLLFSRSNLPSLDEDWSLALFKLGTACMESTRLTGLEREMEPLVAWHAPYIELSPSGRIELVDPLVCRTSPAHHRADTASYRDGIELGGLSREVKEVRIEPTLRASSTLSHAGLARIRALLHFVIATLLVARSLAAMGLRKMLRAVGVADPSVPLWVYRGLRLLRLVWHGRNGEARRSERQQAAQAERRQQQRQRQMQLQQQRSTAPSPSLAAEPSLVASRFEQQAQERGQVVSGSESQRVDDAASYSKIAQEDSDEEDDNYDIMKSEVEAVYDSDGVETDADEGEGLEMETDEVSGLLEELRSFAADESAHATSSSQRTLHSGTEAFNQLLLAHLTRPRGQAPLTRSAYHSLLHFSNSNSNMAPSDLDLAQSLIQRRSSTATHQRSAGDDARRLCVVCCTEERNVICWPCRCLCLCMDCREHLASRPPARRSSIANRHTDDPTHLCPTCRTPVQAFSRLYIP
ncbi:related to ASI1-putative integral membrane E3 ubiquitin ligase [Sporisorium scitamineum]|uniref:Related to ASI1-putative integral membrane E3 ubiquitin ligase n=1 Tax=Sporisorium scitamineum TaxID=49012 RepID=A0A0F7S7A8_9BASI|nr:related to ASI1-putative integral membrane E3 ubiquitin ligase [Sporisorium scitamineum]CDW96775.1 hypothetical protein [Sporisorium scitamineum]